MKDSGYEWVGWLSSAILLATVAKQIHKQWSEHTSRGVSKWLFLGQVAAEIGFIAYSWIVRNWVFVVTNVLLLLENLVGFWLVMRHRHRKPYHLAGACVKDPQIAGGEAAPPSPRG